MSRLVLLLPLVGIALGETYDVAVIPPPSGFTSVQMSGINNSGQVAGFGLIGNTVQAFLGSPEGSTPIPLPAGYSTAQALGLNNSGQVAGWAGTKTSARVRAFIGTPSGVDLIPLPDGWTTSNAYGVNDSGVVVGAGGPDGPLFRVFIGSVAGSAAVPLPLAWTTGVPPESSGYVINNEGQIAGYVTSGTNTSTFLGTAAGVNLIHAPRGWISAGVGYGLNDSGEVAFSGGNGASNYQVFVSTASGTIAIPIPTGATGVGIHGYSNLNNSRTVVGWSDAGAWIWNSSHGTVLLNALVPSVWNVIDAVGISDSGLILAQASLNGGVSQFVELSPARPHPPRR